MSAQGLPAWPQFPSSLLKRLRAAAPAEAVLHLALWSGESVALRRIVEETEDGLLAELNVPSSDAGALVAIPWQAICRVEADPEVGHRARPGFRPDRS